MPDSALVSGSIRPIMGGSTRQHAFLNFFQLRLQLFPSAFQFPDLLVQERSCFQKRNNQFLFVINGRIRELTFYFLSAGLFGFKFSFYLLDLVSYGGLSLEQRDPALSFAPFAFLAGFPVGADSTSLIAGSHLRAGTSGSACDSSPFLYW